MENHLRTKIVDLHFTDKSPFPKLVPGFGPWKKRGIPPSQHLRFCCLLRCMNSTHNVSETPGSLAWGRCLGRCVEFVLLFWWRWKRGLWKTLGSLHWEPFFFEGGEWNLMPKVYCLRLVVLLMAEILHQLIWIISHYLQGFTHPRWCRISSINSINDPWKWWWNRRGHWLPASIYGILTYMKTIKINHSTIHVDKSISHMDGISWYCWWVRKSEKTSWGTGKNMVTTYLHFIRPKRYRISSNSMPDMLIDSVVHHFIP